MHLPQPQVTAMSAVGEAADLFDGYEDGDLLKSTPLAASDNIYEDDADDEAIDLGVQLGKLRLSERIGGWIRAKLVQELDGALDGAPLHQVGFIKSYIGPSEDYIPPTAVESLLGGSLATALDFLPTKQVADSLMAHYFEAVHPIARVVHKPTLEKQYSLFWLSITSGVEPVASLQATIFAAMFSAAVSQSDRALITTLQQGVVAALSKAGFLRTTRLNTMQAFVMYLVAITRAEVSRAGSALVGTAIRLAQAMGMHKDGSHYGLSAVQIQVRRVLWHQLCCLDMRTCEATGPSPQIRRDEHDTEFPINAADELIEAGEVTGWTDTTLFRIRAELTSLRRIVWFDMHRIDRQEKTLGQALVQVQQKSREMREKYLFDLAVPLQHLASCVLEIGLCGLHVQLLHRYIFNTAQAMPDRLKRLLIDNGLQQMQNVIALETTPALRPWSWYRGALNQYHASIFLLREVYANPGHLQAAAIWNCLDYIYSPPAVAPKQKAEIILRELRDLMVRYFEKRRLRLTTNVEAQVLSLSRSLALTTLLQRTQIEAPQVTDEALWNVMDDIDWAEWDQYLPLDNFESGDGLS